jgi:hypothetical protein
MTTFQDRISVSMHFLIVASGIYPQVFDIYPPNANYPQHVTKLVIVPIQILAIKQLKFSDSAATLVENISKY